MKKNIFIICVIFFISCSHGLIGTLPKIENKEEAAELYVIRTSSIKSKLNSFKIQYDGRVLFAIRDGDYTKFLVPAREHTLMIQCEAGKLLEESIATSKMFLNIQCEPGDKQYFVVKPGWETCATIEKISADEAQKLISESDYLQIQSDEDFTE